MELLRVKQLSGRLFVLLLGQVGQQIGDAEYRVSLVLADGDGHSASVLAADHPVEGQGQGGPLEFFDAPVIVGPQIGKAGILHQGMGFEVQARGIDMACHNAHPLRQGTAANGGKQQGFVPVVQIHLFSAGVLFAVFKGPVSGLLQNGDGLLHRLPLNFGLGEELLVAPGEFIRPLVFLLGKGFRAVLPLE